VPAAGELGGQRHRGASVGGSGGGQRQVDERGIGEWQRQPHFEPGGVEQGGEALARLHGLAQFGGDAAHAPGERRLHRGARQIELGLLQRGARRGQRRFGILDLRPAGHQRVGGAVAFELPPGPHRRFGLGALLQQAQFGAGDRRGLLHHRQFVVGGVDAQQLGAGGEVATAAQRVAGALDAAPDLRRQLDDAGRLDAALRRDFELHVFGGGGLQAHPGSCVDRPEHGGPRRLAGDETGQLVAAGQEAEGQQDLQGETDEFHGAAPVEFGT
jgi:hypothetical protein